MGQAFWQPDFTDKKAVFADGNNLRSSQAYITTWYLKMQSMLKSPE